MRLRILLIAVLLVVFARGALFAQTAMDYWNQGNYYFDHGDYTKAIECFLEFKNIVEKALGKEHPDYATSLNNLGVLYWKIGDYVKAERYYLEAAVIWEKVLGEEHPDYASSLNNLGLLYGSMGDYAKTERYMLEAAAIREKALGEEDPDYASSLNNLGLLYWKIGNYAKAERYMLEAATIREKVLGKEHPDYAGSLNNLGLLYKEIGEYAKAEHYYLEAAAISEMLLGKGHPDYAALLDNLGNLYDRMGDYTKAEHYLLESAAIYEKVFGKEHSDYAMSLNNLGVQYFSMGDYAKAERYYLEAAAIKEKTLGKEHPSYAMSLDNLYLLYLIKKEYKQSLVYKQEQININTGIINKNFSFQTEQERDAYWNANSKYFEESYTLSFYHPVLESNILNYEITLFSKGLLLRTTNAVRDAIYASSNQALIAQFEELGSLRQEISALQQNGGDEEFIKSLEDKAEALDKSITQSSAAFRELKADLAINWQTIQKSLQKNEAAIEFVSFRLYGIGIVQYAALVVKKDSKAPEWVPLCEESALTELFAKLDGIRPQDQARILYDEYGFALYNAVWRPLEKTLGNVKTVYYSPSGLLHKVAFNAIPVNTKTRLMDKYGLNLVSSTREVVYLKNKKAGKPGSAVVYGGLNYTVDADTMRREALAYNIQGTRSGSERDGLSVVNTDNYQKKTSGGTSWGYLQFTDTESKSIYQLLTTNKVPSSLLNGVKGNKESFLALNGKKTVVIHLATHGFFNQDIKKNYEEQERLQQIGGKQKAFENPLRRSGLILAGANTWAKNPVEGTGNGVLLADEVAGMNLLGADLIVLSACETALGEVNNSEGVFGLQRAFKLAGAQTLIMSLWKVDDEATSILISAFYKNWLSGKSKQDAFKEAQRSLRSNSRYASPFYWAAFVMMD